MAEAVVAGTIKSEEINIDLLDEKLNVWRIPDPDLGIIYGHVCCTYGVLPWQTRITEFLYVCYYNIFYVLCIYVLYTMFSFLFQHTTFAFLPVCEGFYVFVREVQ